MRYQYNKAPGLPLSVVLQKLTCTQLQHSRSLYRRNNRYYAGRTSSCCTCAKGDQSTNCSCSTQVNLLWGCTLSRDWCIQPEAKSQPSPLRETIGIVSTSLRKHHLTGVDIQQELRRVQGVEWKMAEGSQSHT